MNEKNIMIVGVGGQGSLLASKILGNAVMDQGMDVKVSEVHGMSQRGGSVVTYVKYGKDIASPIINKGEADIILSFELLEAARWLPYLKKDGVIVTNSQRINPMPVITGKASYPEDLAGEIKNKGVKIIECDSLSLAREAGNEKAANVVLIGLLSKYIGINPDVMLRAVKNSVPAKSYDVNKRAFELGASL